MKKLFLISALMLTVFCGKVSAGNYVTITVSSGLTFVVDTSRFPSAVELAKYVLWLDNVTKDWGNNNPYISGNSAFGDNDDDPFN